MGTQQNFSVRMEARNMAYNLFVSTTEATITTTKQQQKQQY
jgi:hypothetical protein